MDIMRTFSAPATGIDSTMNEGFVLNNGYRVADGSGVLLVGGEAFAWRPWTDAGGRNGKKVERRLLNAKGQWDVEQEAWGLLSVVWPKPGMSW